MSGRFAAGPQSSRALSGEAAHVTGQSLVVDGGWTTLGAFPGVLDPAEKKKVRP